MKRALISGIGGQDGSYLADILLEKGYEVHGIIRHATTGNLTNLKHLHGQLVLHKGDITDGLCMDSIISRVQPDEIYHEADQDNVDWSYAFPSYQLNVSAIAVTNLLHSVLEHCKHARVFIPVSATMFGDASAPQTERSPINPLSPYACGKAAAYHIARYYRQAHGMFVSTGILYNHESPRRHSAVYLLQKICKAIALKEKLVLYNMDDMVDIGYAKDYMNYAYDLIQLSHPDDYIICTEYPWTIRLLVDFAYRVVGLNFMEYVIEHTNTIMSRPGPKSCLTGDMSKLNNLITSRNCTLFDTVVYDIIQKYKKEYKCE